MCRSTARTVSTSRAAIAALLRPLAISASTSRSRGDSRASGESTPAARAPSMASTTSGSMVEPPAATVRTAVTSCSGAATLSLSR